MPTTQLPEKQRGTQTRRKAISVKKQVCAALWFLLVCYGLGILREHKKDTWSEPWRGPIVQGRPVADWLEEGDGFSPIEMGGTNVLEYYFEVVKQKLPLGETEHRVHLEPGWDLWGRFIRRQRAVLQVVPEYSCSFSAEIPGMFDHYYQWRRYDYFAPRSLHQILPYARCPHTLNVLIAQLEDRDWQKALLARDFIGEGPEARLALQKLRSDPETAGLWRTEDKLRIDPGSEATLSFFRAVLDSAENDEELIVKIFLALPRRSTNTARLYQEIELSFLPAMVKHLEGYKPRLRQYEQEIGGKFTDLPTVILPVLAEIGPGAKGAISAIFKYLDADHSAHRLLASRAFWKITGERERYRKIVEGIIREGSDGYVLKLTMDAKLPLNYGCPIAGERVITHDFWLNGWQAAAFYAQEAGVELDATLPWLRETTDRWGGWAVYKLTGDTTLLKEQLVGLLSATSPWGEEEMHAIVSFEDFPIEDVDFDLTPYRQSKDFFRRMLAQLLIEKRDNK